MSERIITTVAGEELELHPYRAVYWAAQRCLWLADLHLGKAAHFQRAGLAVSSRVADKNWERLYHLLDVYHPETVIFLGDLFHSAYNREWDVLGHFIRNFYRVRFHLVRGNHDILEEEHYQDFGIHLHEKSLSWGPFDFTHEPREEQPQPLQYNVAGHIHPAVRMFGKANQSLRLPCFYFGEYQGLMPAFGAFTGTAVIRPQRSDQVFLIADDRIIAAENTD